jgi:maltooligosyltrehalose trehalohydrolase
MALRGIWTAARRKDRLFVTKLAMQTMRSEVTGRRCGALSRDGSIQWRVWAPRADRVELVLFDSESSHTVAMEKEEGGYHSHVEANVRDAQRYAYRLNGGPDRPDPCSLWQPEGPTGPSAVVRPESFRWTDESWTGISREDLVIYELHVGTFTPEGTFEAVIPRLHALRELGVTAIEIMPIAQFPGTRNWGYDGVLLYAAQNSYGGPQGLQKLVDAAHDAGLAVILDVVYNHLGPESNFAHEFGPYFTDKYKTPWGQAFNYDDKGCDAVRDWVLDNVRMWLSEFHLDGLRLDAVHAIYDLGARHILRAIKETADEVATQSGRLIHIIAESDLNDPRIVLAPERGGHGLDAQWSDDFHHAVHAYLTGERRGYYSDYGRANQVADVFQSPFLGAWEYSANRGRKHGAPVPPELTGDRFVVCIQNHDQVGNRAVGDRLSVLLGHPAKQRLAACLMLFSPHLPMLFMGEEYGETNPFPFFCSFRGAELVQAVREGRKREFADFVGSADEVPDPDAVGTFESAKLSWAWPKGTLHEGIRNLYADLLAARRHSPAMKDFANRSVRLVGGENNGGVLELIRGGSLHIYFNLSDQPAKLPARDGAGVAKSVLFSSESVRYVGSRMVGEELQELLPFECIAFGPSEYRPI